MYTTTFIILLAAYIYIHNEKKASKLLICSTVLTSRSIHYLSPIVQLHSSEISSRPENRQPRSRTQANQIRSLLLYPFPQLPYHIYTCSLAREITISRSEAARSKKMPAKSYIGAAVEAWARALRNRGHAALPAFFFFLPERGKKAQKRAYKGPSRVLYTYLRARERAERTTETRSVSKEREYPTRRPSMSGGWRSTKSFSSALRAYLHFFLFCRENSSFERVCVYCKLIFLSAAIYSVSRLLISLVVHLFWMQ